MSMTQEKLSVQEEVILALYSELYNRPYDCHSEPGPDGFNVVHVDAQKASFIFSEMMVPAGNYGFYWNHRGPYSEQLQNQLHALDEKEVLIEQYYSDFAVNRKKKLDSLFTRGQQKKISRVATGMREIAQDDKGGELLGSLLYIGRTVMPGRGFEQVNCELQRRKDYFQDTDKNKRAWEALQKLDLVSAEQ